MSLLRGWFKPDYTKPEERFIDPDGAPYDGKPGGERSIRRAVQTPALKATAIASLFLGAAGALCLSPGYQQAALLVLSISFSGGSVIAKRDASRERRREYPSLRTTVVIDKAGRTPSDPRVLFALDDHYRRDVESAPRFLPVIPIIVCGGWTGFNYAMGFPALHYAGLEAVVAAMATVPFAARTAWSAYARLQLQKRRWTVAGNPPPLKKKAKEPARAGLQSALVPARVRAAWVPGGR